MQLLATYVCYRLLPPPFKFLDVLGRPRFLIINLKLVLYNVADNAERYFKFKAQLLLNCYSRLIFLYK